MSSKSTDIAIRHATAADIGNLFDFLYAHGVNEWNHLPPGRFGSILTVSQPENRTR